MSIVFIYVLPIFIVFGGIYLSFSTNIIRDTSTAVTKPYSLARSQLMWWTIIILSCFCIKYGWVPEEVPKLDAMLLALIGIGAGTTTLAGVIDSADKKQNPAVHQNNNSVSFGYDVLDDGDGISIHRFQLLILNVVLGIIFLNSFFLLKDFPKFTGYELGLLGISSGTYLAIKTKENQ